MAGVTDVKIFNLKDLISQDHRASEKKLCENDASLV